MIIILPFIIFYQTVFIQNKETMLTSIYLRHNIVNFFCSFLVNFWKINSYYVKIPIYSAVVFCLFSVARTWAVGEKQKYFLLKKIFIKKVILVLWSKYSRLLLQFHSLLLSLLEVWSLFSLQSDLISKFLSVIIIFWIESMKKLNLSKL